MCCFPDPFMGKLVRKKKNRFLRSAWEMAHSHTALAGTGRKCIFWVYFVPAGVSGGWAEQDFGRWGDALWVPRKWKWLGWVRFPRPTARAPSQPLLPQPSLAFGGNSCRECRAGAMWWLSIKHRLWSQLLATSVNIRTWLLFKPHCSKGGSNESVGIFQGQADMKCSGGVTHTHIFVLSP